MNGKHYYREQRLKAITAYISDYYGQLQRLPNWHELKATCGTSTTTFKADMLELRGRGHLIFGNWSELHRRKYDYRNFL